MLDINKVEVITERDIDLLILEELNTSDSFSAWFYEKNQTDGSKPKTVGAWHSVTDPELGESDLIAIYDNEHAILIENKISADEQSEQAERYYLRGERGIKSGYWKSFTTCMLAPQQYLISKTIKYNNSISYEEIAEWFDNFTDKRSQYRKYIIEEAIDQNRRGYTIKPDVSVTDFWNKYWLHVNENHPKLGMKKPVKKPSRSSYVYFYSPLLPNRYSLVHKLDKGAVDIQISDMVDQVDKLADLLADFDFEVVPAGKSAALRKSTQVIDLQIPFENQLNAVLDALAKAKTLLNLLPKVIEFIEKN